MQRNKASSSASFSPYWALAAAACFGVAGVVMPRPAIAQQAFLVACVVLAAVSLVMNLVSSNEARGRRR